MSVYMKVLEAMQGKSKQGHALSVELRNLKVHMQMKKEIENTMKGK